MNINMILKELNKFQQNKSKIKVYKVYIIGDKS